MMNSKLNQRIRELAFMAIKNPANPFSETEVTGDIHCFDDEELSKFFEMIVNECADLVDEFIANGGVDGRSLKEHFGIKE